MENVFVYFYSKKIPSEFLVVQRAKINEQKVTSNEQKITSNERKVSPPPTDLRTWYIHLCILRSFYSIFLLHSPVLQKAIKRQLVFTGNMLAFIDIIFGMKYVFLL